MRGCPISIHAPHAGSDVRTLIIGVFPSISIHAPHAGSDFFCFFLTPSDELFQSTLPMRGATNGVRTMGNPIRISIHAPHAGSDFHCFAGRNGWQISIHAPHAGSDMRLRFPCIPRCYFNPRSPCGERLPTVDLSSFLDGISIHAPHAGSDSDRENQDSGCYDFNPRSPCGERRPGFLLQ